MKKLALALVCLASVAFFASCDPVVENPEPTISIIADEGFAQNEAVVNLDTPVQFGFTMASNSQTNKELSSLKVTVDDAVWASKDLTGMTEYRYVDTVIYTISRDEIIGASVISATVADAAGETATATINLSINQPATPLLSRTIEWVRRGANVLSEEEMAQYGLKWEGTYKAPFATIKPIDGATLYVCNGDDFANITTDVEKAAYFANLVETGTPAEYYRNVDANQSADYNDMLAVVKGDLRVVIIIKHAQIETGSFGTQITITGEAK